MTKLGVDGGEYANEKPQSVKPQIGLNWIRKEPNSCCFEQGNKFTGRFRWPLGLLLGSTAVRLLALRARIPPGARIFVRCECCVSSGRGLSARG